MEKDRFGKINFRIKHRANRGRLQWIYLGKLTCSIRLRTVKEGWGKLWVEVAVCTPSKIGVLKSPPFSNVAGVTVSSSLLVHLWWPSFCNSLWKGWERETNQIEFVQGNKAAFYIWVSSTKSIQDKEDSNDDTVQDDNHKSNCQRLTMFNAAAPIILIIISNY